MAWYMWPTRIPWQVFQSGDAFETFGSIDIGYLFLFDWSFASTASSLRNARQHQTAPVISFSSSFPAPCHPGVWKSCGQSCQDGCKHPRSSTFSELHVRLTFRKITVWSSNGKNLASDAQRDYKRITVSCIDTVANPALLVISIVWPSKKSDKTREMTATYL